MAPCVARQHVERERADLGRLADVSAPACEHDCGGIDHPSAYEEADLQMRGVQQHVERRIRLWVVQQERVRLMDGQRGGINARAQTPPQAPGPAAEVPSPKR